MPVVKIALALGFWLLAAAGCSSSNDIAFNTRELYSLPNAPYVAHLAAFGSEAELEPPSWFRKWIIGEDIKGVPTIIQPWGIAATKGRIYINDGRAVSGYWILDLAKRKLNLVRSGELRGSIGLTIDDRGFKFFAVPRLLEAKAKGISGTEKEKGAIVVYDTTDRQVQTAEFPGRPIALAVWRDRLFVTDVLNQRIVIMDKRTLKVLDSFGSSGGGDSEFRVPKAIAASEDGRVFVGDTFNGRVKVFDVNGEFLSQYGHRSTLLGSFMNLTGVTVDREGRVYVVDAGARLKPLNEEVQVLDSNKFYLNGEKVAPLDSKPEDRKNAVFGYFQKPNALGNLEDSQIAGSSLYRPLGIAIDYENIGYFEKLMPADSKFKIEYLLWMTSEAAVNGKNVSVFAFMSEL